MASERGEATEANALEPFYPETATGPDYFYIFGNSQGGGGQTGRALMREGASRVRVWRMLHRCFRAVATMERSAAKS